MCIRAEKVALLVEVRENLRGGSTLRQSVTLDSNQCDRLASGFVACNFIIDVVDFLTPIVMGSRELIVSDIRYCDLRDSWEGRNTGNASRIVRPLVEGEEPFRDYNPWRGINRWLAIEALIRVVDGTDVAEGEGRRPSVIAKAAFEGALGRSLPPQSCRVRNTSTTTAFERWWASTASTVTAILAQMKLELQLFSAAAQSFRNTIGSLLAKELHPGPFNLLTRQKNIQLHICMSKLNEEIPYPTDYGWFRDIYQRIKTAIYRDLPFTFENDDLRILRSLLQWVEGNGLARPDLRVFATIGDSLSLGVDDQNRALSELDALARIVRMRKCPEDWVNYRQVEDLFGVPLANDIEFRQWWRNASSYGLTS